MRDANVLPIDDRAAGFICQVYPAEIAVVYRERDAARRQSPASVFEGRHLLRRYSICDADSPSGSSGSIAAVSAISRSISSSNRYIRVRHPQRARSAVRLTHRTWVAAYAATPAAHRRGSDAAPANRPQTYASASIAD